MIAEYGHRAISQISDQPQDAETIWPPINQIAHEPEPITGAIEIDSIEKAQEGLETTLYITDCICSHLKPGALWGHKGH